MDDAVRTAGTAAESLQITLVGDSLVGKTSLLREYTRNDFPDLITMQDFNGHITVDGEEVSMTLRGTVGLEDYEKFRALSYPHTKCFLVCYSMDKRASYHNVVLKWYPELKQFADENIPIVFVDLRAAGGDFITTMEGEKLKKKIRAVQLVECSALERINLSKVFEEAVRAALHPPPPPGP